MPVIYLKKDDEWKVVQTNVQADWDATEGEAQILNKPTDVSEFTNDAGYQTETEVSSAVSSAISTHDASEQAHADIRAEFENYVPVTRTINSKELDDDVTLGLADLAGDSTHRVVTDAEKAAWNAKQDALTFDTTPTADSENPVKSGGVYTALAGKASATTVSEHIADKENPHEVTAAQIGVEDGAQVNVIEGISINGTDVTLTNKKANIPVASASALGLIKVGDNLTIAEDGKLSAVAQAQVQANWTETVTTKPSFIQNKPTLGTAAAKDIAASGDASASQVVLGNDSRLTDARAPTAHAASHVSGTDAIPAATTTVNGLMAAADKVKLEGIEAGAEVNVQSDWDATSGDAAILNKPTALSEFSNDEGFQTEEEVASAIGTHNTSNSAHGDIRNAVDAETSRAEGVESALQSAIDALEAKSDVVDVVGTKAELLAYDTSKLATNDIVKVLVDESQSNAITYYRWVVTGTSGAWTYIGASGPYYSKSEADGYFVPQQRTINGQALTGNVTLDAEDVGALPEDATLADLTGDATHRVVTDTQISAWNAKQDALTFDNAPTADSANPVKSGGVYTALAGKASASDLTSHTGNTNNPHAVTAAQVGLGNVDNTSDANKPISTATQAALDGKVDAVEGKQLSDENYTSAEKTKLAGIAAGAEVNVQSDWTATSGDSLILNKPTLGTAAAKDVPASGNATTTQVVLGSDSRLTNARAPTAHASTHATGGSDAITPADIGAEPAISKNSAFNKNFGTTAGTVCEGNDGRLSNDRNPKSHASTTTAYGVSSASNYGHAMASATTPKVNGTAAVGSETAKFARGDHVHPTQIRYGSSEPSASLGVNGDIYFVIQ